MTDNIRFERFERPGKYNEDRRAEGELRSLIYDFRVLVEGEHVATLSRDFGHGYRLYDAAGRPIPDGYPRHMGEKVERQADFFQFIQDRLDRIPSPTGLLELRCAEAILEIEVEAAARAAIRSSRAAARSEPIYLSLVALVAALDRDRGVKGALRMAEALIFKVEAPASGDELDSAIWSIQRDLPRAVIR